MENLNVKLSKSRKRFFTFWNFILWQLHVSKYGYMLNETDKSNWNECINAWNDSILRTMNDVDILKNVFKKLNKLYSKFLAPLLRNMHFHNSKWGYAEAHCLMVSAAELRSMDDGFESQTRRYVCLWAKTTPKFYAAPAKVIVDSVATTFSHTFL